MKTFKEFQFGWWILILLLPIMIGMNIGVFHDSFKDVGIIPHLVFNITLLTIIAMFYGMTTRVEGDKVIITFGIGLIRKTIDVSKVKNINLVQNPLLYGWGIRMIPNGWLYSISGSEGVELQFADRTSIVRIGSKNAALLRNQIIEHAKLPTLR